MYAIDIPILVYHQITEEIPPANLGMAVSLNQLKSQMEYLHEKGYVCLSLAEVLHSSDIGQPLRKKTFALAFDDGYENFYTLAYPILRYYGFTATVFLITGKTFKQNDPKREADKRYMTWEQIEFLYENNISFGSHTCSHPILTKLPKDEIQRELLNSKADMEAALGQKINWLAYPHGASNTEIHNMARESGYQAAFGGSHEHNSRFNLRRQFCLREESLMVFAFRLSRFYRTLERLRDETKMGWFLRKIKHILGRLK